MSLETNIAILRGRLDDSNRPRLDRVLLGIRARLDKPCVLLNELLSNIENNFGHADIDDVLFIRDEAEALSAEIKRGVKLNYDNIASWDDAFPECGDVYYDEYG